MHIAAGHGPGVRDCPSRPEATQDLVKPQRKGPEVQQPPNGGKHADADTFPS